MRKLFPIQQWPVSAMCHPLATGRRSFFSCPERISSSTPSENASHKSTVSNNSYNNKQFSLNLRGREKHRCRRFLFIYSLISHLNGSLISTLIPSFKQFTGCHLNLRASSGQLDSQMLPAAYPNCTVRFPGVRHGKGMVVQLKRLNVPCSSGHMQLTTISNGAAADPASSSSPPSVVCGKLEELPATSRTFYFRGVEGEAEGNYSRGSAGGDVSPAETSAVLAALSVVNRAVFSVAYRTVDACYNTTLTDASRSIRLRSPSATSAEPLECYFRIHLPYGYRIKINIVTNFRESHVTRGSSRSRTARSSSSSGGGVEVGKYRTSGSKAGVGLQVLKGAVNERVMGASASDENVPVDSVNYVYTSVEQTQQFVDNVNLLQGSEDDQQQPIQESDGYDDDVDDDNGPRYRASDTFMPITSDLHFNYVDNEQSNWRTATEQDEGQGEDEGDAQYGAVDAAVTDYASDCSAAGLSVLLWDGDSVKWSQCYDQYSNSQRISLLSNTNVVGIKVLRQAGSAAAAGESGSERSGFPSLLIEYSAERVDASPCAFGWIGFQQLCIAAVYNKGPLPWQQAEDECQGLGGHLVSIGSRDQQRLIDRYLRRR